MSIATHAGKFSTLIFDFDGVLTDNAVYVFSDGTEMVRCTRADGLAFDAFRILGYKVFIVSTESNPVVHARAAKLKVEVLQGVGNKREAIRELALKHDFSLSETLFIGNDINDLDAMGVCGASACPEDSHPRIRESATFRLNSKGGEGVAREIAETVLQIDIAEILNGRATAVSNFRNTSTKE